MCKGCLAHPCMEVCPKGAISLVNGKSYIDQEKCIKCGKCKASVHMMQFPRESALVQKHVVSMRLKPINGTCICQSGQMCILWYVYGKLSVWSNFRQIPDFQLARALNEGEKIIANRTGIYRAIWR